MSRLLSNVVRLKSDTSAAVAIEFAFIGLTFVFLILSIMILSFTFFQQSYLRYSLDLVRRQIILEGEYVPGKTAGIDATKLICVNSVLDCQKLTVAVGPLRGNKPPRVTCTTAASGTGKKTCTGTGEIAISAATPFKIVAGYPASIDLPLVNSFTFVLYSSSYGRTP